MDSDHNLVMNMSKYEVILNTIIMVFANVISKVVNDIIDDTTSMYDANFIDSQRLTVLLIIMLSAIGIYLLP
jgi:hypothetical protein